MEKLTSASNAKIKHAVRLSESASFRRETGLFVLEGARLCEDAAASGVEIERCFFTAGAIEKYLLRADRILSAAKECYEISEDVLRRLSDTSSPQGIICVCKTLDKIKTINTIVYTGKYLALENLQDPSNLGAAARTAEALGVSGLIVGGGCDIFNPKAQRSAMGALLRLPVIETQDLPALLLSLSEKGMKTFAAVPDSRAESITQTNFSGGAVCVVGNEGAGVTEATAAACSGRITIPMRGRSESLNAACAATILMWEMVKAID